MSTLSVYSTARLLELLRRELEIFSAILELAEKQEELIEADNIDAFSESLDQTRELIGIINGLHQESSVLMQSYMSQSGISGDGKNAEIDTTYRKLGDIIAKCVGLNDKNTTAAKRKTQYYMERIGKLSLSRKSMGSYIQSVANEPEMIDKKM